MWQAVAVLIILGAVLIYLVRHFLRVFRAQDSGCGCCTGCLGPLHDGGLLGCHPQGPRECRNR